MRALITGVGGQDGLHLAAHLLEQGYTVYGIHRRPSRGLAPIYRLNLADVEGVEAMELLEGDALDCKLPVVDEIYNLAAQSHVAYSFKAPQETIRNNISITVRMLEHARHTGAKFYQASTSELFGITPAPQNEESPMHPRSPYGVSKLASYWITRNYREAYGLPTYNGILFNHESPLRGDDFVTQKIAQGVAAIEAGLQDVIMLGNLEARRDWGHAQDYVEAMWLMMQHDPGEYVVATGECHSVGEFCAAAFLAIGEKNWRKYVKTDPKFYRPAEVHELRGDASKLRALGWSPKYRFDQIVAEMVDAARMQHYPADVVQPMRALH